MLAAYKFKSNTEKQIDLKLCWIAVCWCRGMPLLHAPAGSSAPAGCQMLEFGQQSVVAERSCAIIMQQQYGEGMMHRIAC